MSVTSITGHSFEQAIEPEQQIHLPVPKSRGSYAVFPSVGMAARDHFSMRVAPDQSILIFDSDTSGNWPLVRVNRWWTNDPATESLQMPGWSAADAQYLNSIFVDVQVTPDRRFAITFSEAVWKDKSDFLLHVPHGYVARKPDTIITVVDLEHWRISSSVHTAALGILNIRSARIVSNQWIAFDSDTGERPSDHGVYQYLDQLLSVPDLKTGPKCISHRFSYLWQTAPQELVQSTKYQNDLVCQGVLASAGVSSTEAWKLLSVETAESSLKL